MIKSDIHVSIAAGEVLLFLEDLSGSASMEDFARFLRSTGVNMYLILGVLLSEHLISIVRNKDAGLVVVLRKQDSMCII